MPPWPLSLLPSGARATMQAVMGAHAVLTCDMQGRVIDANPALLALLGYGREEMLELNPICLDHTLLRRTCSGTLLA